MGFLSWFTEFCTAFYSTYTSSGSDDISEILTTASTATSVVGAPNVYVEVNDMDNFRISSMYVESLSDDELAKLRQNLTFDELIYQDADSNNIDLGNGKTM